MPLKVDLAKLSLCCGFPAATRGEWGSAVNLKINTRKLGEIVKQLINSVDENFRSFFEPNTEHTMLKQEGCILNVISGIEISISDTGWGKKQEDQSLVLTRLFRGKTGNTQVLTVTLPLKGEGK